MTGALLLALLANEHRATPRVPQEIVREVCAVVEAVFGSARPGGASPLADLDCAKAARRRDGRLPVTVTWGWDDDGQTPDAPVGKPGVACGAGYVLDRRRPKGGGKQRLASLYLTQATGAVRYHAEIAPACAADDGGLHKDDGGWRILR